MAKSALEKQIEKQMKQDKQIADKQRREEQKKDERTTETCA